MNVLAELMWVVALEARVQFLLGTDQPTSTPETRRGIEAAVGGVARLRRSVYEKAMVN